MPTKTVFDKAKKWVLSLGVLLGLIQYLSARSFWLDEAKLGLNIIEKDYLQLLEPLHSNQVAPIFFLWFERFMGQTFGYNEYSLRLLPLLCLIGTLLLFYKILHHFFEDERIIFVALTLMAFCQPMLYFGSELKQYMIDVFIGVLLVYMVLKSTQFRLFQLMTFAVFGVLAIGFSNVAVILLLVLGSCWWWKCYKNTKKIINATILVFVIWIAFFAFYYARFIADHPNRALMLPYWEYAFMPHNPFSVEFWSWCFDRYEMVFSSILGVNKKIPMLYLVFGLAYMVGVYAFAKAKKYTILWLLIAPLLIHLLLSAFHLYPFERRMGLYLQPSLAIITSYGFVFLFKLIRAKLPWKLLDIGLVFPGLILLVITLYTFPKKREEFKESVSFMQSHLQDDDLILRGRGADNPWDLYTKSGYLNVKNKTHQLGSYGDDYEKHQITLDTLKGRVWLFIASDRRNKTTDEMESAYLLRALRQKGSLLQSFETIGSAAYLLELE